ncbi:succinyl-diaminopimelate desuccinylase [Thalassotalea fusca]
MRATQQHNVQSQQDQFYLSKLSHYLMPLLAIESVTPNDNGCQDFLEKALSLLGFDCHRFTVNGVSNLIAKIGVGNMRIAFAGHTDVVPPGDLSKWTTAPFSPEIRNGNLYARGVADMKGGIAAMLSAFAQVKSRLNLDDYSFYFLITSDEEGEAEHGTIEIVNLLKRINELPDLCIVGEPSATQNTGDTIKIGRRGAISCEATVKGKQGHVAYPQFAMNAAHSAAELALRLSQISWDEGSADFPGSSLQITNIDTGEWTDNIIPGESQVHFNVRYSHKFSEACVKKTVLSAIDELQVDHQGIELDWQRPCHPYYTRGSEHSPIQLVTIAEQAVFDVCQTFPKLSTSGGTSDGRFIAAAGTQVIELGVPNHSIHQVDEHVAINDLIQLEHIYKKILVRLMN